MTRPDRTRWTARDNGGVLAARGVNLTPLVGPLGRARAGLRRCRPPFRRGDLADLHVVSRRGWHRRAGGVHTRGGYNGVAPLDKGGAPLGNRVYGVVYLEARPAGLSRLVALSRGVL